MPLNSLIVLAHYKLCCLIVYHYLLKKMLAFNPETRASFKRGASNWKFSCSYIPSLSFYHLFLSKHIAYWKISKIKSFAMIGLRSLSSFDLVVNRSLFGYFFIMSSSLALVIVRKFFKVLLLGELISLIAIH